MATTNEGQYKYLDYEGLKEFTKILKGKFDDVNAVINGKSKVEFTGILNSGTQIGTIKIDGATTTLFTPPDTTYTFTNGTGGSFKVKPSVGTQQTVTVGMPEHTHHYNTLTGSTTTANQAIISTGEANGWTLKTLGSNAFSSTVFATTDELTSGLSGKLGINEKAANSELLDGHDSEYFATAESVTDLTTEVEGKAPIDSPEFINTPKAPTAPAGTKTFQIATTEFVNNEINNILQASDAMRFKGTLGTGGTITALPASHSVGDTYKVITTGTYAGAKCEIGDMVICITDGTTANNAHWTVVQTNTDGHVVGPENSTNDGIAVFDGTTGKVIKSSTTTLTTLANTYATKKELTDGLATKLNTSGGELTGNLTAPKFIGALQGHNVPFDGGVFQIYNAQPLIGTENGSAFSGSSNNFKLWSFPEAGTAVNNTSSGKTANVGILRFGWSTGYLHDIFYSPNKRHLWHRYATTSTAQPWYRLVEEDGGDSNQQNWNINISGNADTATNATQLGGTSVVNKWDGATKGIPRFLSDGVMGIGRVIDFHIASEPSGTYYATRLRCQETVTGVQVYLPSTSGTLALTTSNVASATKLANARTLWGQSFDGTADISGEITLSGNGMKVVNVKAKATSDYTGLIAYMSTSSPTSETGGVVFNGSSATYKYGVNALNIFNTRGDIHYEAATNYHHIFHNNVSAPDFITTSDARLKDFVDDIAIDFDALKSIPKKTYYWKDKDKYGDQLEIGTSAQELMKVYPECVSYDDESDKYSVNYQKLSIVALAAIDKLHDENAELKSRLDKIEKLLNI